jgi:hypothetical protein
MRNLGWNERFFLMRIATILERFDSSDGFESADGACLGVFRTPFFKPQFLLFFSFVFMLPSP